MPELRVKRYDAKTVAAFRMKLIGRHRKQNPGRALAGLVIGAGVEVDEGVLHRGQGPAREGPRRVLLGPRRTARSHSVLTANLMHCRLVHSNLFS